MNLLQKMFGKNESYPEPEVREPPASPSQPAAPRPFVSPSQLTPPDGFASETHPPARDRLASGAPVRQIFSDPALNQTLAKDGVVAFPWLSEEKVAGLARIVRELGSSVDFADAHIPTRFRLSAFTNDAAYKTGLYDAIYDYFREDLAKLIPGYEPLVINVFEKPPGSGADQVPIHQNPSFVDEPEHKSVSMWIPLQDVTKENGTVGVFRGSHEYFNTMRAGNMAHEDVFGEVAEQLETELFEPLDLKAGEVAAVDDSIIHWSYPNRSSAVRTAVQLIMVPSNTQHIYYYYNETGPEPVMDLYEVDKHFFFAFNCKELPAGLPYIKSVPFRYEQVTREQLMEIR